MGNVGTVMTSRSYRFKPEIRGTDLDIVLASAEGKVVVRLDVTSPVMMTNAMLGTRSVGSSCLVTELYITYRSVDPGEWRHDLTIVCGKRQPAELGDEDYAIRVSQWANGQIVQAPDWVRDIVADRMPSERIGE